MNRSAKVLKKEGDERTGVDGKGLIAQPVLRKLHDLLTIRLAEYLARKKEKYCHYTEAKKYTQEATP
jgi:hydroxymethylglutaryl-CoA reductase